MSHPFSHIRNYRQASSSLATSGQPSETDLHAIAGDGYEVVINLALHDDPRYSLNDEHGLVEGLGMIYVHIPVQFGAPTRADLETFLDAMTQHKSRKVWLHCAANYRATAFLGIYRLLREGWDYPQAFELLATVWEPDDVWSAFILECLGER